MKNLIALCLMTLSMACQAAPTDPKKWDSTTTDAQKLKDVKANYRAVCERMSGYAATIMAMRQDNYAFTEVIKVMEMQTGGNELDPMVMDAYETIYFRRHEPMTTDAIRSFANKWGLICVKYFRR